MTIAAVAALGVAALSGCGGPDPRYGGGALNLGCSVSFAGTAVHAVGPGDSSLCKAVQKAHPLWATTSDVTTGGSQRSGRRWAYLPRPGDPDTMTTLTLQGGSVTDVDRKLVR